MERCKVCDRPEATDEERALAYGCASGDVTHCPCPPSVFAACHGHGTPECRDRAVDWRARALAAEAQERARVVAWLRRPGTSPNARSIADGIEQGNHVDGGAKGGGTEFVAYDEAQDFTPEQRKALIEDLARDGGGRVA